MPTQNLRTLVQGRAQSSGDAICFRSPSRCPRQYCCRPNPPRVKSAEHARDGQLPCDDLRKEFVAECASCSRRRLIFGSYTAAVHGCLSLRWVVPAHPCLHSRQAVEAPRIRMTVCPPPNVAFDRLLTEIDGFPVDESTFRILPRTVHHPVCSRARSLVPRAPLLSTSPLTAVVELLSYMWTLSHRFHRCSPTTTTQQSTSPTDFVLFPRVQQSVNHTTT